MTHGGSAVYKKESLLTCFNGVSDPRGSNARHPLQSVLFIALCAVISGAESWDDREFYALSPGSFETAFQHWVKSIVSCLAGDIIPIDGKRIRGAFRCGSENIIHQVNAWSYAHQLV